MNEDMETGAGPFWLFSEQAALGQSNNYGAHTFQGIYDTAEDAKAAFDEQSNMWGQIATFDGEVFTVVWQYGDGRVIWSLTCAAPNAYKWYET